MIMRKDLISLIIASLALSLSAEGAAIGHLLARSPYKNTTPYLYYWGSGWSKGSMPDMDSWIQYLKEFRQRIDNPLKYSVSD